MSLARTAARAISRRSAPVARRFATESGVPTGATSPFLARIEAVEHHAEQTTELWRKISYFFCLPAMIICSAYVYKVEVEHEQHAEHAKEENGGVTPYAPEYEYLNRRVAPYPWGPNSLFFNPKVQRDLTEA